MTYLTVSKTAMQRYRETVSDQSERIIRLALASHAVAIAAAIGAPFVRLPGGQRIVLVGSTIVTVLPAKYSKRLLALHRASNA